MTEPSCAAPRVVEVEFWTDPRWEAFVTRHPDAVVFHHPAWLRALEREYGHRTFGLACEDIDGQFRGVLALSHTPGWPFARRGSPTGRQLSSLPRTEVAGPLALDERAAAALVRAAVERVRGEPGARLQIKAPSTGLDGLVDGVIGVPGNALYVLELPEQPHELRFGTSRNHLRIKWAVNKAAKLGVQVRSAATEGDLLAWYELYLDTMRYHAAPPRPYRFFEGCWDLLRPRGLMRLLLAEQHAAGRSTLLAGSILLMFGQTVFYAFNGRCRDQLSLRPNDVIQWQAIQDARREGFRYYNFGTVLEDNQGLAQFKSKWGAEPRRKYNYYYPAPQGLGPTAARSDGRARQLARAAWRRLPLKATAMVGDWLHSRL